MDQLIALPVFAKEAGVPLGVLQKHLSQGLTVPLPVAVVIEGEKKSVSVYRCTELRSWWRTAYRAPGVKAPTALPHTANSLILIHTTGMKQAVHVYEWTSTAVRIVVGWFDRETGQHVDHNGMRVAYLPPAGE